MNKIDVHLYTEMFHILDSLNEPLVVQELGNVIASLEFLCSQISTQDAEWLTEFKRKWWVLEEVYAVLLSQQRGLLGNEEINLIRQTQSEMKEMLASKFVNDSPIYS